MLLTRGRQIDLHSLQLFTFKQSNSDCFLLGFLSVSPEAEVMAHLLAGFETSLNGLFTRRCCYREGKAMKITQIGKLKV